MKNLKKVLALVLAVVMIMGVVTVASAKTYKDADAEAFKNYADAIDALSSLKILDGFEDETFKADGTLTRAQAAKIVAIVHNAATNGRIQSDIADLYSNAQNPFVDCNTSWALPYINYCRITGLADGMTATTYAPKREVTGVQFLKLMLTTLNFNTAKEGYTGTGWDINVLNRANEIGLTAGLEKGWKAIAPIKRGEAAQVLYNALTAYLVEYGQKVKNNYVNDTTLGKYYNYSFISNEQVAKSGYTLGGKMGISITRATDDFRRPGYNWSYGSWSAFYMDKPLNSYTTAVSACTILKNDMGVSETSGKTVSLNGFYKGVTTGTDATTKASELKVDGKAADYTALNYFAVDGFKFTDVTLVHDRNKACQNIGGTKWTNAQFGGQGDLTQVFKTEDGYVITVIHTFLAEVKSVTKNNKYSHATPESATVNVWMQNAKEAAAFNNDPPYTPYEPNPETAQVKAVTNVDYAVGTKVLVNLTLKKDEATNYTYYYSWGDGKDSAAATIVAAADSKTGKLTGASNAAYAESVSIDGTKYPGACRFVLGEDDAMKFANYGKNFTFYFDTYGNVIGCTEPTTAASYVVMNKIYAEHTGGDFVIKADLYDLDGKKIEAATIAQAGSFDGAKDGYDYAGNYVDYTNMSFQQAGWNYVFVNAKHNDPKLLNALYSYTVNEKGVYTLTWVGVYEAMAGFSRLEGKYTHTAKLAYIYEGANTLTAAVKLSESSKIVVKSIGGEWTSYTGYTALPALTAAYVDYVDNDNDGYADIVYLGNAVFAGDSITGWVTNWGRFNWANGYDLVTVYVEGEPVVVNVKNPLGTTDSATELLKTGMYTFEIGKDADGVAYATAYKRNADISGYVQLDTISADSTSITMKDTGEVIGLTGVAIYAVNADGTVTKADASIFVAGWDYIEYFKAGNRGSAPYAELYVIDRNLVSSLYTVTP
jgi:hypothetical protein